MNKILKNIVQTDVPIKHLLISDASDKKVAILNHGDIFLILEHDFTFTESQYSSAHRELLFSSLIVKNQKPVLFLPFYIGKLIIQVFTIFLKGAVEMSQMSLYKIHF